MKEFTILLQEEVACFYEKIAIFQQVKAEAIIEDTLIKIVDLFSKYNT